MRSTALLSIIGALCFTGVAHAEGAALEFTLEQLDELEHPDDGESADKVAEALGEMHWGMSRRQVLEVLKEKVRAEYEPRIRQARDSIQQDQVMEAAREAYRRIRDSYVAFDGHVGGWDVSPIAPEFRHGSQEAMLVVGDINAREYYFFINDRLWKYYRELPAAASSGRSDAQMKSALEGQFGRAEEQFAQRDGDDQPTHFLEWTAQDTRLSALQRGAQYCLIFEHAQTLAHLPTLRAHALVRKPKRSGAVEAVLMDDAQREAFHDEVDRKLARQVEEHNRRERAGR